jgi:predicted nucleic acid-binding protein
MILLDTDVMIDVLRRYPPAVAWLESLGNEEIRLPVLW